MRTKITHEWELWQFCDSLFQKFCSNKGLQRDGAVGQINQYMISTETDIAFLVIDASKKQSASKQ